MIPIWVPNSFRPISASHIIHNIQLSQIIPFNSHQSRKILVKCVSDLSCTRSMARVSMLSHQNRSSTLRPIYKSSFTTLAKPGGNIHFDFSRFRAEHVVENHRIMDQQANCVRIQVDSLMKNSESIYLYSKCVITGFMKACSWRFDMYHQLFPGKGFIISSVRVLSPTNFPSTENGSRFKGLW